ncbi:MAG: glycosyltransferase family 4 protein [Solirubrobacteraceae bacterium]
MDDGLVMVCDVDLAIPDGARTHTVELAHGFQRAGLSVTLIARGPDPALPGVAFRRARGAEHERGVRMWELNRRAIASLLRERRRARRLYVREKWTTVPVALAGRALGYRVVAEVDDVPYGPSFRGQIPAFVDWFKRGAMFTMGRLATGMVAGTEEARSLLVSEFHVPARKLGVVPIGVDVEFFQPRDRAACIASAGLDPARTYLLFLGNFAPWVDFDTLLDAFARVHAAAPATALLLVGDGAQRGRVEELAGWHGVADAVTITGYVRDRERIRDLLGAATVLLASHRGEHLDRIGMNATKIAEYLASGRPVVAKDVARLREMIEAPGAGRVATTAAGLADAILEILSSGRVAEMGEAARRAAVERWSWAATVRRTMPLFEPGTVR